jgi:hypothetical protein
MEEIHILPIADLREHEESAGCWCCPKIEKETHRDLIIHNSLDRREVYEINPELQIN